MIIERVIGCVPIEVNTCEANEIYLTKEHASYISEAGISGIINAIYNINDRDHMPLSVFIELTSYCNFSCPFCYINEEKGIHNHIPRFEVLQQTLDYLINSGMVHCVLSGGECLLHPDFAQIYQYLKISGVLVTIFTNGYLLDDKLFALLSEYKPFKIEISLYGKDDQSYRIATKVKNIQANRVFENVLKLKELGLNVICKTPITCLTENCYKDLQKWCEDNAILYYTGTELMDTYSGTGRNEYLASPEIQTALRQESDKAFFENPEMMEIAYSERKRKINFDCTAGRTDIMIDSQFNLLPCMKAAWIPKWKFSIQKHGIQAAYKRLVEKIQIAKGTPLRYCVGCSHSQVCQECFMTQFEYPNLREHRTEYCNFLCEFLKQRQ